MGSKQTFRLDHTIYSPESIAAGTREFAEFCDVGAEPQANSTVITVSPRANAPEETIDELLSYILSAALEAQLSR